MLQASRTNHFRMEFIGTLYLTLETLHCTLVIVDQIDQLVFASLVFDHIPELGESIVLYVPYTYDKNCLILFIK